jgi:aryl-alcohol dehydrogenase-like predicted oxidoreductase
MKHVTILRTDLSVSSLCLGAGGFGDNIPEALAFSLLDRFVQGGGNFIDTANVYGRWLPSGLNESERMIGRWLRTQAPSVSSRLVVATKGAHPDLATMNRSRLDRASISRDIDESRAALGLDRIGLYWLHRDDPSQDAGDIHDLMETFVAEGRIRWYGASNWRAHRIEAAQRRAERTGATGFVAVQNRWSLARVNPDALPSPTHVAMDGTLHSLHQRTGIAAVPYTSLAYGYFSKRAAAEATGGVLSAELAEPFDDPLNDRRFAALKALSAERGVPIAQLALAFLMNQPFATAPIVSFPSVEKLEDGLAAGDLTLTADEMARLGCGPSW